MASSKSAAKVGTRGKVTEDSSPMPGKTNNEPTNDSVIRFTPPIGPDAGEYKMNHANRGKAIIFNHEKFDDALELEERTGTQDDKNKLKESLEKFKFEVEIIDDPTFADIKNCLHNVSLDNHKNEDCLVIAVLTHGEKGKLLAYDVHYKIEELWSSFTGDQCPSLGGRPKIFIIQACRGEGVSKGVNFNSKIQVDSRKATEPSHHRYSLPVEADILFAYSTHEGRVAMRNTEEGSWFIQELCDELDENGEQMDLLSLFTNVNRRVAVNKEYKKQKQMPVIQSTLTRKLFLRTSEIVNDRPTIMKDIDTLLGTTNSKLDLICKMLENKRESLPVQKTKPAVKQSPVSRWEKLQYLADMIPISLPDTETVYKHGEALKMFLEDEGAKLTELVLKEGLLVLNLLSCWENLSDDLKCFAYKTLVIFLNENAANWKVFKFLNIPDLSSISQHCHRRYSNSDVTDMGTSFGRTSSNSSIRRTPKKPIEKK